jgi:basic amino acid/polyamine antiporter, APA family
MPLKRNLNLFDATLLVVGNVVGAGIFTASGFPAKELSDPWLFLAAWAMGGLLTVCGALTYAELSGMFPRSGGDYLFLKASYGPWAGFLLGWISFWVITPGSIAVLSISMVKYITGLVGPMGNVGEKATAVAIIGVFSFLNYRSVRLSSTMQNLWTLGALALVVTLIAGGLWSGKGDWGHFATSGSAPLQPLKIFGPAMVAVLFAYSGWFVTAYVGDEVKRPERNVPLSIFLGTATVTALYLLVNVVYLYALPMDDLKGVINVGQIAAVRLLSGWATHLVGIAVVFAIGAGINATVLAGARLSYAMATDGRIGLPLKKVHAERGTPHGAILAQACMASLFVVAESFENLLNSVVFVMLLTSIATGVAHMALRTRAPLIRRPYRTWGYPCVPLVFVASYTWIAVQIALASPGRCLAGLAITASGIPFYFFVRLKKADGRAMPGVERK